MSIEVVFWLEFKADSKPEEVSDGSLECNRTSVEAKPCISRTDSLSSSKPTKSSWSPSGETHRVNTSQRLADQPAKTCEKEAAKSKRA